MRIPRIVEAMNDIDDDLVSWAVDYRRVPISARLRQKPVLRACACLVIIACACVLLLFRGKTDNVSSSPYILKAYAASQNSVTTAAVLEKGQQIPVSLFQTNSGLTGFVISYNKTDDDLPSSISIISKGDYQESIHEIVGIAIDTTQNYCFCIPAEGEEEPYTFPLLITDFENELICQYEISIELVGDIYYAELTEETVIELRTESDSEK